MERGEPVERQGFQWAQIKLFAWFDSGIFKGGDISGTGAENGNFLILGHLPQGIRARMERVAVIKNQGCPNGQGCGQPVPHHPAAGGEIEDGVFSFQIGMQKQFFQLVEQNTACTLDHAFGQAGCAGGIHDIEGMFEGQLGKFYFAGIVAAKITVMDCSREDWQDQVYPLV